jgi:hypothetical protein
VSAPTPPTRTARTTNGVVVQRGTNYDEAAIERLAAAAANGEVPVPPAAFANASVAATAKRCLANGAELRGNERPIEIVEARFSGTAADLGVYRVPGTGGGPDRVVVWVVAQKDCSVLSFTQHLLPG